MRKDVQAHEQSCSYWRQLCPMGCGTMLVRENQAQHNCYRELHQRFVTERQKQRAVATNLRRTIMRMQSRMAQMKRQMNLLCENLEVGDLEVTAAHQGSNALTNSNISPNHSRRHSSRARPT